MKIKLSVSKRELKLLYFVLNLLSKKDRVKLFRIAITQFCIGLLDLVGVVFIGALGALSINGVNSRAPGERVTQFLTLMRIEDLKFEAQAAILALAAMVILVSRTILAVFYSKNTLRFLSDKAAEISIHLYRKIIKGDIGQIQTSHSQEILFAVNRGVDLLVVLIIGTSVNLMADIASLITISIGLFVVDPFMAIASFILFTITGIILNKLTQSRARFYAQEKTKYEIKANNKLLETLETFRELYVRNREEFYISQFSELRKKYTRAVSEVTFLPNVSKFVIETVVLVGAILIGASQFILNDAFRAVGTLSVFLAAGTRIAPAFLRIQQSILAMKSAENQIQPTLNLITRYDLQAKGFTEPKSATSKSNLDDVKVEFKDVSFSYNGDSKFMIQNFTETLNVNEVSALVGSSGSGKSTIFDLMLGIHQPRSGSIRISGLEPREFIEQFAGLVSYVPQDISIVSGSVRENVCLGYALDDFSDLRVWEALEMAKLKSDVEEFEELLDTHVGERGNKLSGGQRQRLGLARALLTRPRLLLLDEATSSLDARTEVQVSEAIQGLKGKVTVVLIAHRLSSIRNADKVIYMKGGKLVASGKFEEVRRLVPAFNEEANLMGL
jgi:ATP-binding cassette subfamily C protein